MLDPIWEPARSRAPEHLFAAFPLVPKLVVHIAAWRLRGPLLPSLSSAKEGDRTGGLHDLPWPEAEAIHQFLFAAETAELPRCRVPGLRASAERLALAVQRGEVIGLHGDYDVDGLTSTALLAEWLRGLGLRVETVLPNRMVDGYGLGNRALERLAERGCRLVIAVDCGITAVTAAQRARALGVELIILDHHEPSETLPEAALLVDPKLPEADGSDRDLAAVGLAYRLAETMAHLGCGDQRRLASSLDLVALGTIADVCPLTGQNRLLVARGLARLRANRRPGLAALIASAGLHAERLSAEDVAFRLAPRLNAAGRLDDPGIAFELLGTDAPERAAELAEELERLNRRRQALTDAAVAEAVAQLGGVNGVPKLLVTTGRDWHQGIVGLVAGKLADRYHRPAIALTLVADRYVGSARSVDGFDIAGALLTCRELLITGGGHARAAGLKLQLAALDPLRLRLQEIAGALLSDEHLRHRYTADARVKLGTLTPELLHELGRLGPFGEGNPAPLLLAERVAIADRRIVGKTGMHAQFRLRQGDSLLKGVQFHVDPATLLPQGSVADILFVPRLDHYGGTERVELRLEGMRGASS